MRTTCGIAFLNFPMNLPAQNKQSLGGPFRYQIQICYGVLFSAGKSAVQALLEQPSKLFFLLQVKETIEADLSSTACLPVSSSRCLVQLDFLFFPKVCTQHA